MTTISAPDEHEPSTHVEFAGCLKFRVHTPRGNQERGEARCPREEKKIHQCNLESTSPGQQLPLQNAVRLTSRPFSKVHATYDSPGIDHGTRICLWQCTFSSIWSELAYQVTLLNFALDVSVGVSLARLHPSFGTSIGEIPDSD